MLHYGFVTTVPSVFQARSKLPASRTQRPRTACVRMDAGEEKETKRNIRRRIVAWEGFRRQGYKDTKEAAKETMDKYYLSDVVKEFRENGFQLQRGDISWKLAKAYGFCWGVERAVSQAFEAAEKHPDRNVYLTNEIIHNPTVNEQLKAKGVKFLPSEGNVKDYSSVTKEDVVILPAFGAELKDMVYLRENTHEIVDTTCPWVSRVWKQMDDHHLKNVTSIVHGKYAHEETVATVSFGTKYLVVKDMAQAEYVSNYILNGGDREEFLEKFKHAYSEGFDPDTDLKAVGVANQTTMLKSETAAIAKLFEKTMMKLHDAETFKKSFVATDTICDATQERQDAMTELLKSEDLDLMIVVGGFNSSNTSHLQEMAEMKGVTSYWIDRADRITPDNKIWARTAHGHERLVENFLPNRPLAIGITSGASSPDMAVEQSMDRINLVHAVLRGESA